MYAGMLSLIKLFKQTVSFRVNRVFPCQPCLSVSVVSFRVNRFFPCQPCLTLGTIEQKSQLNVVHRSILSWIHLYSAYLPTHITNYNTVCYHFADNNSVHFCGTQLELVQSFLQENVMSKCYYPNRMVIHPHKTTCIQNKASEYASDINTTL